MAITIRSAVDSVKNQEVRLRSSLQKKRRELRKKKQFLIRGYRLRCVSCNERRALHKFQFIQNLWYERPHGCMGGDNWHNSETRLCHLICPVCENENYICTHQNEKKLVDLIDKSGLDKAEIFSCIWEQAEDGDKKQVFPKLPDSSDHLDF